VSGGQKLPAVNIIFIILFVLCVAVSAFLSVVQITFIALQRHKLEHMIETKVAGAAEIAGIAHKPQKLLSTLLLGNTFVNTAAAVLGTAVAVQYWGNNGTVVAIIGVTIILLIFADTIPKTAAAHRAESLSLRLVKGVKFLVWVLSPFVAVLSWIATAFGKLVGSHTIGGSLISEEEIRSMINAGSRDGTVEKAEAQMLHKVFEFGDRPAREVMVPRTEVVWLEKGTAIEEFLKIYSARPLNRYPVFEGKRDNVAGIVSSKDILLALAQGACDINHTIDDIIRPAHFCPENQLINEIMAEMQEKQFHMCVIVDEYGGTAGILTMTQIVEEIIGDVKDELAVVEKDFEIINETTFKIDGNMRVEDVNQEMGLNIPEGEYETAAGFILKLLGHIPKSGEQLHYKDLKIAITRMAGLKIEEIVITKEKHAETADQIQPRPPG
jgi:putative hemolysin